MGNRSVRQDAVFAYLIANINQWVDGFALTEPNIGGSEGLRRLRELRRMGYPIQKRRKEDSSAFQYRLVSYV